MEHQTESDSKAVQRPADLGRACEIIRSLVEKGYAQTWGIGWNERVKRARDFLAETQRSSSDEPAK